MSDGGSSKVLKEANFKWLVGLAAADVLILVLLFAPTMFSDWEKGEPAVFRLFLTAVLPVAVLLLSGLIPQNVKASIVFWKWKHALPGHEAFSKHAAGDNRIDHAALRRVVGPFPAGAEEQNALWYRLYKKVDSEPSVMDAHRGYLLFRDLAAMSVLLLVLVPSGLALGGVTGPALIAAVALFLAQYAAAAISAKNSAIRFVQNVLAVHAAKDLEGGRKILRVT